MQYEILATRYDAQGNEVGSVTCKSRAEQRRIHAQERAKAIAALGMQPEDMTSADTRYAATTGEMISWLRQDAAR